MSRKTFRAALNEALHQEMATDPRVVVFGEDITGGTGGDDSNSGPDPSVFGIAGP